MNNVKSIIQSHNNFILSKYNKMTSIMILTITVLLVKISLKCRKVISIVIDVCCGITHHTVLASNKLR